MLYVFIQTLGETLIPSNLQPLPERYTIVLTSTTSLSYIMMYIKCYLSYTSSLAEDLKNFSVNITEWLLDALEDLPAQLGIRKMHGECLSVCVVCSSCG